MRDYFFTNVKHSIRFLKNVSYTALPQVIVFKLVNATLLPSTFVWKKKKNLKLFKLA